MIGLVSDSIKKSFYVSQNVLKMWYSQIQILDESGIKNLYPILIWSRF